MKPIKLYEGLTVINHALAYDSDRIVKLICYHNNDDTQFIHGSFKITEISTTDVTFVDQETGISIKVDLKLVPNDPGVQFESDDKIVKIFEESKHVNPDVIEFLDNGNKHMWILDYIRTPVLATVYQYTSFAVKFNYMSDTGEASCETIPHWYESANNIRVILIDTPEVNAQVSNESNDGVT